MAIYPRYPYSYYNSTYYNKYNTNSNNQNHSNTNEIYKNINKQKTNRITETSNTIPNPLSFLPTSLGPLNFHPEGLANNEQPLFEMFGITLYLDDIIILCILFFLYKEGIKDDMLYISLFLLLIS